MHFEETCDFFLRFRMDRLVKRLQGSFVTAFEEMADYVNEPALIFIGSIRRALHKLSPVSAAFRRISRICVAHLTEVVHECRKFSHH
mmetsp:Transcript_21823/g.36508  ORF Transcript_21823/g.36508 Transcript_21823/m.36508 type:complete len:87 (-) Transcript_21823:976-1236(-)